MFRKLWRRNKRPDVSCPEHGAFCDRKTVETSRGTLETTASRLPPEKR